MSETSEAWFLAQLKPNSAKLAQSNLERQGFRTFLPLENVTRRAAGRFRPAFAPVFPGYIFVAFDPDDGHWRTINSTSGISRLVCFAHAPAKVPDGIVDNLLAHCGPDGCLRVDETLNPGERVRITSGPFSEFAATVHALDPDRRVWVLIDLMGGRTPVRIEPAGLKRA